MQTKKRYYSTVSIVLLAIMVWVGYAYNSRITFESVQTATKPLNFDNDIDFVIAKAKSLGDNVAEEKVLAADVIAECESMRMLFQQSFERPISGSIDFILNIHQDSGGGKPLQGYDHERSQNLVFKVILDNKYDLVVSEGSGFDGFDTDTQIKEVCARLKYEQRSPAYLGLLQRGVDPSSYEQAKGLLYDLIENSKGQSQDWLKLQKQSTSKFCAGESIPISAFVGRLILGRISNSESRELINHLQRLRSAYAVAKTAKELKNKPNQRAAIVFGFLHEDDFREIASALNINARTCNATGVSTSVLKEKR